MKEIHDILTGGFDHLESMDVPKTEYQIKAEKHRVTLKTIIPYIESCIEIVEYNETFSFARFGNISTITGQSGAKKTFFVSALAGAWINPGKLVLNRIKATPPNDKRKVLYFDTEQSEGDFLEVLKRVIKIAGFETLTTEHEDLIYCYSINAMSPKERHEFIKESIENENNIGLVIIDGVKDLMTSANNEEQTSVIITDLLKWVNDKKIHICSILHENPNGEKMRGHIGTELINKCETVVSIQKHNENALRSEVVPKKTRKKQFTNFAFRISENGIPIFDELFQPKKMGAPSKFSISNLKTQEIEELLKIAFKVEKELSANELIDNLQYAVKDYFKTTIGRTTTKEFLTYLRGKELVLKLDPENQKSKFKSALIR